MGELQLRRIRNKLITEYTDLVDMSDFPFQNDPHQMQLNFLSKAQMAFSVARLSKSSYKDTADAITDGFKDNGIDIIFNDKINEVLYLGQSKWKNDGSGTFSKSEVLSFFKGIKDLISCSFDEFNNKIQAKAEEIEALLDNGKYRIRFVITYTGDQPLGDEAKRYIDSQLSELNSTGELYSLEIVDQSTLHSYLADDYDQRSIDLKNLTIREWGYIEEPIVSYYGYINIDQLCELFLTHGNYLFAKNLRNFRGITEVNDQIKNTILKDPNNFWYFNNGITLLCDGIEKTLRNGNNRDYGVFDCYGISVINGAQTIGVASELLKSGQKNVHEIRIQIRIISLQNINDSETYSVQITKSSNTQNRVDSKDFAAMDPIHEKLRYELYLEQIIYVYKTGDPIPKNKEFFTFEDAAVALACSLGKMSYCTQAKSYVSGLWLNIEKEPYKDLFNGNLTALQLYNRVKVLKETDKKISELKQTAKNKSYAILTHGNRFILYEVFQRIDMSGFDRKQEINDVLLIVNKISDMIVHIENIINSIYTNNYLNSLFKNTRKCEDISLKLKQFI